MQAVTTNNLSNESRCLQSLAGLSASSSRWFCQCKWQRYPVVSIERHSCSSTSRRSRCHVSNLPTISGRLFGHFWQQHIGLDSLEYLFYYVRRNRNDEIDPRPVVAQRVVSS